MPAKHQKIEIKIPNELGPAERREVADLVIERIVDRTLSGVDKNGREFKGYSKEYIKSLDFKNAGKSAGEVNLQLSGDMLAAIDLLNQSRGKIVVGFENGTEENARADGNIRGTYGQDKPNKKKARDFLGISKKELQSIIDLVVGSRER